MLNNNSTQQQQQDNSSSGVNSMKSNKSAISTATTSPTEAQIYTNKRMPLPEQPKLLPPKQDNLLSLARWNSGIQTGRIVTSNHQQQQQQQCVIVANNNSNSDGSSRGGVLLKADKDKTIELQAQEINQLKKQLASLQCQQQLHQINVSARLVGLLAQLLLFCSYFYCLFSRGTLAKFKRDLKISRTYSVRS